MKKNLNEIDASIEITDELNEVGVAEIVDSASDDNVQPEPVNEVSEDVASEVASEETDVEEVDTEADTEAEEVETEAEEVETEAEEVDTEALAEVEADKPKATKKAPKKAERKLNRSDIIEAFKEKEELRMRNVAEKEEQSLKWHIVQDYLHTKKIARGTVISVEETPSGMVIAVVNFNDFRVVIPASEFFIKPIAVEEGVSDHQRIRREKQVIVKSLGAEVEFVIVHAKQENNKETKQKEYIVLASRKQALLRQIKYYFGKKNGVRRVEPGKIIRNVPIIAVGKEALMVSVCGIDKVMNKAQLSYKFLGTLVDSFYVGDRIDIAVLDVIDKENGDVDIQISHKQTQLEQFKRNVTNCSVGGMYRGVITIVKDNTVQLYLTDVDVPAFSKIVKLNNIEELPSAGDTVLIVANKIVPERGLVLGTIIRLIKK